MRGIKTPSRAVYKLYFLSIVLLSLYHEKLQKKGNWSQMSRNQHDFLCSKYDRVHSFRQKTP